MDMPSPRQLQRFLLTHRGSITFVALALCIWSVSSGFHRGAPVVMSARALQVGETISNKDVYVVYVDGSRREYVESLDRVLGETIRTEVSAGTPLVSEMLSQRPVESGLVTVSVSLDEADPANYAPGTQVHVWKLTEEFAELVSTEARVVRANKSRIGANSVTLKIPRADEAIVIQANAVRLVSLS